MDSNLLIAIASGVAVAVTLATIVFQAGRLTARVESLEQFRDEVKTLIERDAYPLRHHP